MKFSMLDFRLRGKKQIGNFDSLTNFGHRPMLSRPGAPLNLGKKVQRSGALKF